MKNCNYILEHQRESYLNYDYIVSSDSYIPNTIIKLNKLTNTIEYTKKFDLKIKHIYVYKNKVYLINTKGTNRNYKLIILSSNGRVIKTKDLALDDNYVPEKIFVNSENIVVLIRTRDKRKYFMYVMNNKLEEIKVI